MTSPVVDALAAATAAYLGVLASGTLDDEADAAMARLAPVGLGGLGPDEESHVIADARRVEVTAHTAPERDDPGRRPVQSGLRHVSPAGQAAYGPAAATDGTATAVSWVAFDRREGDRLWASAGEASPVPLGPPRTVVLRQVVATRGPVTWVVGSERGPHGWGVVAHEAARPEVHEAVGHPDAHAVNAEAAMGTDGSLHVVAQQVVDGTFRVAHHERTATGWTEPTLVSPPGESAWDPGVVAAGAEVWVVWTSHRRGRFRVVARRRTHAGWQTEEEVPLEADGHALHPAAALGPGGTLWLACDVLEAENLAASGRTAYVAAGGLRGSGTHTPLPGYALTAHVAVMCRTPSGWARPAGTPLRERSSASVPRVAVDGSGRLWLAYRTMRQLPLRNYVAHVAVRAHLGDSWSEPTLAAESDGSNTELSLLPRPDGVAVVYHGDGHHQRVTQMFRGGAPAGPGDPDTGDPRMGAEEVRREHLALPSAGSMSTGSHLGSGQVCLAEMRWSGTDPAPRPQLVPVLSGQASTVRTRVAPAGWPPPSTGGRGYRLYWGDLHRHSTISRCAAGLDIGTGDHYRLAEDVLACDFWALTDHAENTSDVAWHHLKNLANAFYRPGAHVPLIGFEWTSFDAGHLNVIYRGDDGPIFSSADDETRTPDGLWAALGDHEALTIPHHPAALVYATDWAYRSDRFLRLVEVFQAATGSYESPFCLRQYHDAVAPGSTVEEALRAGHRLGFVASTDHRNGAAYLGLYAEDLTREAVFDALRDRRTFAASRRGIVPHLRIGDGWPGGAVRVGEPGAGRPMVEFGAEGVHELAVVQLVRDGVVVADSRNEDEHRSSEGDAERELTVAIDLRMASAQDGPRDWPGFLRVEGTGRVVPTAFVAPEVTHMDTRSVAWDVALPDRYGGRPRAPGVVVLGATVLGRPDTVVRVEAGTCALVARLGDLVGSDHAGVRSPVELTARGPGAELTLRAGAGAVGGLVGMGRTRWTGTASGDLLTPGSWLYARVVQVDGEMAWSSPVWVDPVDG